MIFRNFNQIVEQQSISEKKKVILVCAHDSHALEAVLSAQKEGIVDYIFVGLGEKILELGKELGVEIDPDLIVETKDDIAAAEKAVELIREKKGDFLMKGKLETATLLRAVLNREKGIRTDSTMSHISIMEIPNYHKLLCVTDAGMIPYPTLEQKKWIIHNSVTFLRNLGYEKPKVAIMAASETVNPRMPETEDAVALKAMAQEGVFGECIVEGPISYDLTMSLESAQIKGYSSPVTGDADIMVVPNIASGNLLCKCMIYTGNAMMAGCVSGAQVPIVLTSRGATTEEKRLSLLMGAASASNR